MGGRLDVDCHGFLRGCVDVGGRVVGSILADVEVWGQVAEDHVVEAGHRDGAVADCFCEVAAPEARVWHYEIEAGVGGGDA